MKHRDWIVGIALVIAAASGSERACHLGLANRLVCTRCDTTAGEP
jgi:hypothetical protein